MKTILISLLITLATLSSQAWELYRFGPTWNWTSEPADYGSGSRFTFPTYDTSTVGYMVGGVFTTDARYVGDLRGKTVSFRVDLSSSGTSNFVFGGQISVPPWNTGNIPPSFRLFLTSTEPPFSVAASNGDQLNYWCSQAIDGPMGISLDWLSSVGTAIVSINVTNTLWTAAHGQRSDGEFATDFLNCVSRIRQIGIMFGGGSFFDVGCAVRPNTGAATLTLSNFTVTGSGVVPVGSEDYDGE